MVKVRLPNGKAVEHEEGASVAEVIERVDADVARQALAAKINGEVVDLATPLGDHGAEAAVLTFKDEEGLRVARHSCAHVAAEAICDLWPETKLVYGPAVEDGFYYDIDLDHPITPEDFPKIEARMAEIAQEDRPFRRYDLPRDEALAKLRAEGNEYKLDNALRADGETLSFYVTGEPGPGRFEDLCRGPHLPSTAKIGVFKIMQVSGAYYRGDASSKMLQRVYGTTWPTRKELKQHLQRLEEAKKRDHRKIGQDLGLFTIDALVGSGLVLWKPRGAVIRYTLEQTLLQELLRHGYQPVYSPHIGKLDLYRTSGHFPYYKDSQYPPLFESDRARELNRLWELVATKGGHRAGEAELALFERLAQQYPELQAAGYPADAPAAERLKRIRAWLSQQDGYLLKPMNCPHHVQMYASEPRSYRDLPVRLAEFGTVYRYEQSGEVSGMTRVRGFTQDDAHVFCTPEQLPAEIADCIELSTFVLKLIGLDEFRVRLGLRDRATGKHIGSDESWSRAEAALRETVQASGMDYFEQVGEATFYGPKVDFIVKDAIGREWQLGTVQVDYNLPERFDLRYIGTDNQEHRPVMIHRALYGSMERFVGILIEHFAGAFPLWLAPIQATICSVSEKSADYARRIFTLCRQTNLRVELDDSGERIGAKIRKATLMKVPYILVVGEQEARNETVNVRTREGRQLGSCSVPEFLAACAQEILNRGAKAPGEGGQASPA
jgi:threonyl-tRNA synthetase